MTLFGAPLSVIGPAAAVGSAALVALYVLRLRRRRVEVPFANLWQKILRDTESTALWRRLRRLISLLVQVALLVSVLVAVGDPRLAASDSGRSLALLIDTSASMQAFDGSGAGGQNRLEAAREAARALVRSLGSADSAMIITVDGRPAPATGLLNDDRELLRAIDRLEPTDTPADLERALRLAADALHGRPRPTLVLIGDGAYDPTVIDRIKLRGAPSTRLSTIDLTSVDMRFVPVGQSGDNVGLTAFSVRRYRANQTAYEVLVEVHSYRDKPSTVKLELVQDGEVVEVEELTLKPGERVQRLYPNLAGAGTRLEARLTTGDVFALDDHAYALLPARAKQKVMLVTAGNLFLEGALLLDENIAFEKVLPSAYDAQKTAGVDAVVLDAFVPETQPLVHTLYVDPRGPGSPFTVRGEIAAPYVTEVAAEHPLMRWVTLKDLNISRASHFHLRAGDVAIASSLRQPIIAARTEGGKKQVALGFDIRKSDLPLRVAFPVLVVNALDWFAGADSGLMPSYATGQPWRLQPPPGAETLTVRGPDGKLVKAPIHDGRATYYGLKTGYYEITGGARGTPPRLLAANLASASESRILPRRELVVDGQALRAPDAGRLGVKRALWPYLVLFALGLAIAEWWTYNRRVTV